MQFDYGVTFACYNQWPYTAQCLDSLIRSGTPPARIVAVDNASADATVQRLAKYDLRRVISNRSNFGCGVAWNQGIMELQTEWTIIMNNDVLVTDGWAQNLIEAAVRAKLRLASPAMVNGDDPTIVNSYASQARENRDLRDHVRTGLCHGVAMLVHASVFQEIGLFRPTPSLMGYEDTLFFHDAQKSKIRLGTVGTGWMHHFGSITQMAMKAEKGLGANDGLGKPGAHKALGLSWFKRKMGKFQKRTREREYRDLELKKFNLTLNSWQITGKPTLWL